MNIITDMVAILVSIASDVSNEATIRIRAAELAIVFSAKHLDYNANTT